MFDSLPVDPEVLKHWTWADFEPYYQDLVQRNITSGQITNFLSDWTRISEAVEETYSRLHVAMTKNTADKEAEELFHTFLDNVFPPSEEAEQKLKSKLLDLGTEPPRFEIPLMRMRTDAEIFREENLPLQVREHKLSTEYDKIIGAQTVQWEGKEVTIVQLRPIFQKTDRSMRENAWRLAMDRQLTDRGAIGDLWQQFMEIRLQQAANAGFSDYRSFRWKQYHRFDYTPHDCLRFHEAIERAVVPAAMRVAERRKRLLGMESLRPWDMDVDPLGRPPLAPFREVSELKVRVASMFYNLDETLGRYFDTMVREDLLDLDNRKNKAPGGYCTEFAVAKRPFIFMNAVGIHDDVQTLLHESGHGFHVFERSHLPFHQQHSVGMEFSEVASMGMELLASPYLSEEKGGFYSLADAARALVEHLEHGIMFWPYMAAVDAFQHWVYVHPEESSLPSNCDAQWKMLSERFMPWVDWTGLEQEHITGWQRKLHIHVVPFYYVEYGIAQLGAVQVWRNSLKDEAAAVKAYRDSLALGGTVALPSLFEAAGARFAFDSDMLGAAVSLMEQKLEKLRQ
ncbi:MAG: M3 family oligoendopeptidase [Desulfomonile tiedjei]|uniref:M3 family oligoendopeptidase n=1 Tax=Desulfomonile tiedjei TaxID=2358 RepID=A0A9D6V201_9BACT|nr:M3 family oligoendopeptidase [Desulfomonile tiedjei]